MTTNYRLFWNSTDGQACLHMGDFASEQEARDAIPQAVAFIEAEGGSADGYWSIDAVPVIDGAEQEDESETVWRSRPDWKR